MEEYLKTLIIFAIVTLAFIDAGLLGRFLFTYLNAFLEDSKK